MQVFNETPFTFVPIVGKVIFPKDTLTVVVKGTFRLAPDRPAEPVPPDQQLYPTGDLHYDDNPNAGCRYASDFVHFKPKADVLLLGHCHTPGGQLRPACNARLRLGGIDKTLVVFGDRHYRRTRMGTRKISEPEPFARMALRYENSYGGPGYEANPVGKGARFADHGRDQRDDAVPNIKVLVGEKLKTMPMGAPSGFGPLGRTWAHRMALVGTYDEKWNKERWPWLPEDFRWDHCNAAPPDQQIKGYLNGDEALLVENIHPQYPLFNCALPGIRVRCFLSDQHGGAGCFREVQTQLDTLWIDMDADTLVLVWRGLATISTSDCEQVEDLLIVQEPVHQAPRPLEYYEQMLKENKAGSASEQDPAEAEAAAQRAAGKDIAKAASPPAAAAQAGAGETRLKDALQKAMAQAHALLLQSGLDPKLVNALKAEKNPDRFAEIVIQKMNVDPRAARQLNARSREQFKAMLAKHRPEIEKILLRQGYDAGVMNEMQAFLDQKTPSEAPPAPDVEGLAAAARSGEDMAGRDMSGADFSGMPLERANFQKAQLEGADFSNALLSGADFSSASLEGANFEGADLTGAKLMAADLSGARVSGAILTRADLTGAVITQAALQEADLQNAVLIAAQLGQADLSGARLKGANLTQADLTRAILVQADLSEAVLDFTVLDGADLTRADLGRVNAKKASFNASMLVEANFSHAGLEACDFSGSNCDHAAFEAAVLAHATFENAAGHHVNFREAVVDRIRAGENTSLPGSIFRRATGARGNWAGADLKGSDFILADMPHCDFSRADLAGSNCRTAELRGGVFDKACLHNAYFNRANLFQARLEEADLTHADFKGANLYGSEFLNATIDKKTNFKGANLKSTKLANLKR